ncbi:MAG: DUF2283 domain-containing protein [Thermoanaerobaculia bacterium]
MKYIYDSETDSLAIILADRRAAGSEEVWPGVIVDFDEAGRPVAFDFSSASESIDVAGLADGQTVRIADPDRVSSAAVIDCSELRVRREALGLSLEDLGRALDIPKNTIARWERGELRIERARMLSLALRGLIRRTKASMASAGPAAASELRDTAPLLVRTNHAGQIVSSKTSRRTATSSSKRRK